MSREDQLIGLSPQALDILKGCWKSHWTGKYLSKEYCLSTKDLNCRYTCNLQIPELEDCVIKEETNFFINGMYYNKYSLNKYIFRDHSFLVEYVQEAPWSSGPVIFLALIDKNDNVLINSLWTEDQIKFTFGED